MNATFLQATQIANAKIIDKALQEIGLQNIYLRAGILAVCSKESGLIPHRENSYRNTPASRIRKIFGLSNMTDAQIDAIKVDDRKFFNLVYSNNKALGNQGGDDGYNFRGAGFNQLTGRWAFQDKGKKINVDLVNHPEKMEDPEIAAKVLVRFFWDSLVAGQGTGLMQSRYGINLTKEISDIKTGARIAHQCNMGWKFLPETDPTGGYQITMADAPSYLTFLQNLK